MRVSLTQQIQHFRSRTRFEITLDEIPNESTVLVFHLVRLLNTIVDVIAAGQHLFQFIRTVDQLLLGNHLIHGHFTGRCLIEGEQFTAKLYGTFEDIELGIRILFREILTPNDAPTGGFIQTGGVLRSLYTTGATLFCGTGAWAIESMPGNESAILFVV